jgi:hypothetical protein
VSASATRAGKSSGKKSNNANSFIDFAIICLYDGFVEGNVVVNREDWDLYTIM